MVLPSALSKVTTERHDGHTEGPYYAYCCMANPRMERESSTHLQHGENDFRLRLINSLAIGAARLAGLIRAKGLNHAVLKGLLPDPKVALNRQRLPVSKARRAFRCVLTHVSIRRIILRYIRSSEQFRRRFLQLALYVIIVVAFSLFRTVSHRKIPPFFIPLFPNRCEICNICGVGHCRVITSSRQRGDSSD